MITLSHDFCMIFSEHNGRSTSVYTPFSMAWVVALHTQYGLDMVHGKSVKFGACAYLR
jgi:hypothetical protein